MDPERPPMDNVMKAVMGATEDNPERYAQAVINAARERGEDEASIEITDDCTVHYAADMDTPSGVYFTYGPLERMAFLEEFLSESDDAPWRDDEEQDAPDWPAMAYGHAGCASTAAGPRGPG